ncbi:hypothetical protein AGMMS4956_08520 [Bacteroidia bacterium]|nr:hypothetical protein AGMMS4956_08520 [Bacteroidia bacterium]
MAIVRMTSEEIREKYPLTPEVLQQLNDICERYENVEVDDPDCLEMTDEMLATATRPGVMTDALFAQMKREDEAIRVARTHVAPETPKVPITFYIEPTILASLRKKSGKNWQTRLNSGVERWLRQAAMA